MSEELKVSLCLITKNEEHCILSCIHSVQDLVHEVIVVDTGSSDGTVSLARDSGFRVFHFPWTGDFSQARNFSLQQATGQWILVLDADEVLAPTGVKEFYSLLANEEVEGYFLDIVNFFEESGPSVSADKVVRLFRNKTEYRFTGAIHEQVAPAILKVNGSGLAVSPLVVFHYGYLEQEIVKKDKFNRNTSILFRELARSPDDPFLLYSLALEYYQGNRVEQGVECLEKALVKMSGAEGYFTDLLVHLAMGLWSLGRYEELLNFTDKSLSMLPVQGDLLLLKGLACLKQKKYSQAARVFQAVIKITDKKIFSDAKAFCLAGDACRLSGDFLQAEKMYLQALKKSTDFTYPLAQILGLIQKGNILLDCKSLIQGWSVQQKDSFRQFLSGSGEKPLALAVLLLEIYQGTLTPESGVSRTDLTGELLELMKKVSLGSADPRIMEEAALAVREIYSCSSMLEKGYDGIYFQAGERMRSLIHQLLLLVIGKGCPEWRSGPLVMDFICS
ncbi:glycosyltransferase [Desulforamulus ruminis]|uniref:Glycosyl transferase family 2 n=1 Tax=Desulforamulus ruminis (strain ATCC 23193 / DSM 2154 / NCIMB 8452 / DL) TaxID=696281 RepID=F6DN53_DESRL|nr:glycosyltransferase [Desulforamulus ruminis]AEG60642.1 glycosyl transferase family 2 [Desulforamulus ruminis DSM 2154]